MAQQRSALPLPHAYPFLLLDRIVQIEPGVSAMAIKNLTHGDPLLDENGYLPPVLLAEALAQCAGLAVLGTRPGGSAVLARIERFRSRSGVGSGDQLLVSARVLRKLGAVAKVRGLVRVGRRIYAAGDTVLQLYQDAFPRR